MTRTLAEITADLSHICQELDAMQLEHTARCTAHHPPAADVIHLSVRHRIVLRGLIRGQSHRELARRLGISQQAVKDYVAEIQQALDEPDELTITEGLRA